MCLPNDYTLDNVNDSSNFVSPETIARTQNAENIWTCVTQKKEI